MQSRNFLVTRRPRLASITAHPRMDFADYERRLALSQGTLQLIQQAYLGTSERALVVLEGWDTAGKGGVVRRLGWALDLRSFKVHPIAAPNQHERAQHYFERFWCRLPENGQIVLFDRSWYGRVLVERVEGFCSRRQSARSASPRGYQARLPARQAEGQAEAELAMKRRNCGQCGRGALWSEA